MGPLFFRRLGPFLCLRDRLPLDDKPFRSRSPIGAEVGRGSPINPRTPNRTIATFTANISRPRALTLETALAFGNGLAAPLAAAIFTATSHTTPANPS